MKGIIFVGIALIAIGAAILGCREFSFKKEEKHLDLGPIKVTSERTKTIPISPIIGWVLIGTGTGVLIVGARSKN